MSSSEHAGSSERAISDVGRFTADPAQRTPVTTGWIVRYGLLYLGQNISCLLYTSPSPRDQRGSRMPSSA